MKKIVALSKIDCFSGLKNESAVRFLKDFEKAREIDNITADKFKRYYFKMKLNGLPKE